VKKWKSGNGDAARRGTAAEPSDLSTFSLFPLRRSVQEPAEFDDALRRPFDVMLQPFVVVAVAKANGEETERLGVRSRNGQVAGVATDHAQGIDQPA